MYSGGIVWQAVPQNSGELVYSQVVALTVTAVNINTAAIAKITSQRTGRFKPESHFVNRFIRGVLLLAHHCEASSLERLFPRRIVRQKLDEGEIM